MHDKVPELPVALDHTGKTVLQSESVLNLGSSKDFDDPTLFYHGIISEQRGDYQASLKYFERILRSPSSVVALEDVWLQIGRVYEKQNDRVRARDAYEHVVQLNPRHTKVLQQLGWLYHQGDSPLQNQDLAITYLRKSLEVNGSEAHSWHLLGRAYFAARQYSKVYSAYLQALCLDDCNPTLWCSIGDLFSYAGLHHEALDGYKRAIRINPYMPKAWLNIGSLYECCNMIIDAINAYTCAIEFDPDNPIILQRLNLLRKAHQKHTSLSEPVSDQSNDLGGGEDLDFGLENLVLLDEKKVKESRTDNEGTSANQANDDHDDSGAGGGTPGSQNELKINAATSVPIPLPTSADVAQDDDTMQQKLQISNEVLGKFLSWTL